MGFCPAPAELNDAHGYREDDAIDDDGDEANPKARVGDCGGWRHTFPQLLRVSIFTVGADQAIAEMRQFIDCGGAAAFRAVASFRCHVI